MREYYLSLIRGERKGLWAASQRLALRVASWPYALAVRVRNALYDAGWKRSYPAPVPVVSVGNLTVGGTGKTPCVEFVARWYRDRDVRVAVLSRGYGGGGGPNDEALLLEENLPDVPHLQGPDRVALAAVAAEELESELLILDDGFQHRRLRRDLDIVLVDATAPWGYGSVLPGGLLREPASGLRRAGLIVVTRSDQADAGRLAEIDSRLSRLVPRTPVARAAHRPCALVNAAGAEAPLDGLRGRPVAAFCGIGNPEAFRRTLAGLGAAPRDLRVFPDHHRYTRGDVEGLRAWARGQPADCVVVTTQKDLVKVRLPVLGERRLWALRVRLEVTAGAEQVDCMLKGVLT